MLVVPDMVHAPSGLHLNDGYIASRLDITNDLEVRNYLGTNLVAARLHHPFFQPPVRASFVAFGIRLHWRITSREPQHVPVVVHPQENASTLKVGKCDQLLRQLARVDRPIGLALDAGVLIVRDQLEKLCLCHRFTSKTVLATPTFECVLSPFEQLFHQFSNGSSVDCTHMFRRDLRAPRIRLA